MSRPAPRRMDFVATCPRGAEQCLADELAGILDLKPTTDRGAVFFSGPLSLGYRACLWSRVASRVLLVLRSFPAATADALYDGVYRFPWADHLAEPEGTIAIDFIGVSESIRNSRFGALRVKDAIVDHVRGRTRRRPNVDLENPDLRINVHLRNGVATMSLDLSGRALHERGDQGERRTGEAPLKTTLAAALVRMAGWPELATQGVPLVDPMCGSGTLLLEAAGMALDRAPAVTRARWGFDKWPHHDPRMWRRLLREADARADVAATRPVTILGFDRSDPVLRRAQHNARRLRLPITFDACHLADQHPPDSQRDDVPRGLLLTNPPFGERLGDEHAAQATYRELGDVLRHRFLGWQAWILAGSSVMAKAIGLKTSARIPIHNGPLECRWLRIDVRNTPVTGLGPGWRDKGTFGE